MKFSDSTSHNEETLHFFMWMNFVFMIIYLPKLVYLIFHFLNFIINLFLKEKIFLIRYAGVLVGMFVIILLCHGAFVNPRNIQVRTVQVEVENLPAAFEGYKIAQISDIHLGSWGENHSYLKPVIDSINVQNVDIIVFTGDIVNNYTQEMNGWQPLFKQLKAKDGKFAILGNHDYGDYSEWKQPKDKENNLESIKQNIRNFGFRLLLNEHVNLRQDTDSLCLIGVENWGKPPFPKYGNLKQALSGTDSVSLKILLSHDPSHWKSEVQNYPQIFLTLSGHTHSAQISFNMYGKLISPSSLIYDEWDGLYESDNQYLYVNRGLGFIGIPVRVGVARPDVTVIILRRKP
ncbi:MAG: metallophosphoesterase [Paludibacter sp.]|nr:metallophosphoesterase [Paludibacter sp.]